VGEHQVAAAVQPGRAAEVVREAVVRRDALGVQLPVRRRLLIVAVEPGERTGRRAAAGCAGVDERDVGAIGGKTVGDRRADDAGADYYGVRCTFSYLF
jgi:hypothetical protein